MAKKKKEKPNRRLAGNLAAFNPVDVAKVHREARKSNYGYYKLAFSEAFSYLTDHDIDIRQDYAKDLIARYHGMSKQFLSFRKKTTKQEGITLDEVFYVRTGETPIGKVSIRVTRLGKRNNLFISYQVKKTHDNKQSLSYKSSNKRLQKRKNKKRNQGQSRKSRKTR